MPSSITNISMVGKDTDLIIFFNLHYHGLRQHPFGFLEAFTLKFFVKLIFDRDSLRFRGP